MCLCVCVRPYIFKCACVLSCRVRMHVCVYVWETVCLYVHVCVLCKRTVCACMCIWLCFYDLVVVFQVSWRACIVASKRFLHIRKRASCLMEKSLRVWKSSSFLILTSTQRTLILPNPPPSHAQIVAIRSWVLCCHGDQRLVFLMTLCVCTHTRTYAHTMCVHTHTRTHAQTRKRRERERGSGGIPETEKYNTDWKEIETKVERSFWRDIYINIKIAREKTILHVLYIVLCMCINTYYIMLYMCIYTHVCMYIHTYMYAYVCMFCTWCMYLCKRVNICMCMCTYLDRHLCVDIYTHMCVSMCIGIHAHMCIYAWIIHI